MSKAIEDLTDAIKALNEDLTEELGNLNAGIANAVSQLVMIEERLYGINASMGVGRRV